MNQEALEVLQETRNLISDPERWATGDLIKRDGEYELPRYCLVGALGIAKGFTDEDLDYEGQKIYDAAKNSDGSGQILADAIIDYVKTNEIISFTDHLIKLFATDPSSVWDFNDNLNVRHSDIMNVLDLAIEKAKE